MEKRNLNRDLISFKKNSVVIASKELKAKNFSKEELFELFTKVPHVVALQNELMFLGYMIDLDTLVNMSEEEARRISCNILSYASDFLGANKDWKPLYGGFPAQVQDMSEYELFVDQIVHYMSFGTWVPSVPEKYKALKSTKSFESPSYVTLKGISQEEFYNIFYRICGSVNSITDFDKESLEWFLANEVDNLDLNITIPFKENLCMFLNEYPQFIESHSVTINDILRTVVYRQDGDITLPALPKKLIFKKSSTFVWQSRINKVENPERAVFKFKKLSRPERRYFLELIEKKVADKGVKACVLDAKKYYGRWIRLGEILHPGQYAERYENCFKFFYSLRNNAEDFTTWNSQVMELYRKFGGKKIDCDMRNIINKVSERPGEFIRRFDSIYRRSDSTSKEVLIKELCDLTGAASKTLIEFYTHIDKRGEVMPRFINTPGSRKKVQLPSLQPLSQDEIKTIKGAIFKALINTLKTKDSWKGKTIVIDDNLSGMFFPTDMRTLSEGKITVPRGTKIPFDNVGPNGEDTIRFYTHWNDPAGTIDLDLHAQFISEDFKKAEAVGWNSFNKNAKYSTFSGDVRHRVGSCAEYIDIRIKEAIEAGWRYVVMNVNSFNHQPFNTIESTLGFTYRKNPKESLTWEPNQVVQSVKLTSDAINICAAIIDLKEEYIKIVDFDWNGIPIANRNNWIDVTRFYIKNPELNISLILQLNAVARNAKECISLQDYEAQELKKMEETNAKGLDYTPDESNVIIFKAQDFMDDYTKILNLV